MMRANSGLFLLVLVLLVSLVSLSCSHGEVPELYQRGVAKLKDELETLEKIPIEKTVTESKGSPGSYTGVIDYSSRSEYLRKDRGTWQEIIELLDDLLASEKLNNWYDDTLFCKALLLLTVASLDPSSDSTDSAINSMTEFIDFDEDSEIESWTKEQLRTVFWDKMGALFSEAGPEKRNLDVFFHIGIASLLERKGTEPKLALAEYQKVLQIDPHGFFADQARRQIGFLKKTLNTEVERKPKD